ncbi:uncharacterized protein A4U43_C08F60 [Asparagus officinalis]|nr:uncharacterized protein A4U43_C08F60 [Asparagus officinalis]
MSNGRLPSPQKPFCGILLLFMVEARDDTQGDLPEDAVKGHHESISSSIFGQENQQHVTSTSAGTEEDSLPEPEAVQHEKQQQEEEVETHRINQEEVTQQQDQAQDQERNSDAASLALTNEEEQQLQEPRATGQRNDDQQQIEEQNNEEHHHHHQQQQQQQSEINKEEQNQEDTNNNGAQNVIEQVIDGSHSKEEEGGIISQSQIEHDIDGTAENNQNSQQEEQQLDNQQQQQEQQQEQSQEQQEQVQPQEQQQDEQQEQQLEQQQQELQQDQQQQEQQEEQQQEQEQQQQQEQQEEQQQEQEEHQQEQRQQESSQSQQTEYESTIGGNNENSQQNEDNQIVNEPLRDGGTQSVVAEENKSDEGTWVTQADQSSSEKERRKEEVLSHEGGNISGGEWESCNVTAGPDYIPCLDNEKAIKQLHSFGHFEHRERHCPEESPTCLVPLPKGYRRSIQWPQSRDRIWYNNVPRTKLAEVKGHQNWVKVTGEYLTFPGGGTQFIHGALHYIDFVQKSVPEIAWGGALLLELNRVLRPGGFFVWSATPVYQKLNEDVEIWDGDSPHPPPKPKPKEKTSVDSIMYFLNYYGSREG